MRRARRAGPLRSPWAGPLGLHVPGSTVLHRIPAGVKLLVLAALGVLLLATRGPQVPLVVLGLAVVAAAWAGMPWRRTLHSLLPVLLAIVVVAAYQWWARGWAVALEVTAEVVALVLASSVVTATTPADRLLDLVARAARPLRHVGLRPQLVALTMAMMLRAVPVLLGSATEARDAARARGLERSPRAVLVPAAVRMVGHGYRVGDALAARGVVEDDAGG